MSISDQRSINPYSKQIKGRPISEYQKRTQQYQQSQQQGYQGEFQLFNQNQRPLTAKQRNKQEIFDYIHGTQINTYTAPAQPKQTPTQKYMAQLSLPLVEEQKLQGKQINLNAQRNEDIKQANKQQLNKFFSKKQMQYRVAFPNTSKIDVSSKFWQESNEYMKNNQRAQSQFSKRPNSAYVGQQFPQENEEMLEQHSDFNESLENVAQAFNQKANFHRALYNTQKPYGFLAKLGGNSTSYYEMSEAFKQNIQEMEVKEDKFKDQKALLSEQADQIHQFSNFNIDKSIKSQMSKFTKKEVLQQKNGNGQQQKKQRPTTALTGKASQRQQFFKKQQEQQQQGNRPQTALAGQIRPLTGTTNADKLEGKPKKKGSKKKQKGSQMQLSSEISELSEQQIVQEKGQKGHRPGTAFAGSKTTTSKASNKLRPMTAKYQGNQGKQQTQGQFQANEVDTEQYIQEDLYEGSQNDQFYDKMDKIAKQFRPKSSYMSNLMKSRPISGRSVAPQSFFHAFTKYCNFAEVELPFEELFDRNERTISATYAKFGDLGYYSPYQRIGNYMQYAAKLKQIHLLEIINLQKTITNVEKSEYEIPIQLAILDEMNPNQNRSKTGISTPFHPDDVKRVPITLSLYPEYMEEADEKISSYEASQKLFQRLLDSMNGNYDPGLIGKECNQWSDPNQWPKKLQEQVATSIARYMHYINSTIIKPHEISPFNKQWIMNSCALLTENLLANQSYTKLVISEIIQNYQLAMKEAMMNYILRCPAERKRLHIEYLPRKILTSGDRIAREGGYCITLYPQWHSYVINSKENMLQQLLLNNIIHSSIVDWFWDFGTMLLIEIETMKRIGVLGNSLTIARFFKQQTNFKERCSALLHHVWFRGALLIIKKFKFLRKTGIKKGKWTLNGFIQDFQVLDDNYLQWQKKVIFESFNTDLIKEIEMKLGDCQVITDKDDLEQDQFEQIYETLLKFKLNHECQQTQDFGQYQAYNLGQLGDIRINPSYKQFCSAAKKKIDFQENEWKFFSKELKLKIQDNLATLMALQLRSIIERTLNRYQQLILQVPTLTLVKAQKSILAEYTKKKQNSKNKKVEMPLNFILEKGDNIKQPLLSRYETQLRIIKHNLKLYDLLITSEQQVKFKRQLTVRQLHTDYQVTQIELATEEPHKQIGETEKLPRKNSQMLKKGKDEKYSSLLNLVSGGTELKLIAPEFMKYQNCFCPFLQIKIILESDTLKFKESLEFIKNQFEIHFRSIVHSFDDFIHPNWLKVQISEDQNDASVNQNNNNNNNQEDQQRNAEMDVINNLQQDNLDRFYQHFCEFVTIKEKPPKKQIQNIFAKEQTNETVPSLEYLQIVNNEEENFERILGRIQKHVMYHYFECFQAFEIFDQFKPFFERSVSAEVKQFLARKNIPIQEYISFIEALKKFEGLAHKLPKNIYFPLFDINCKGAIKEILNIIEEQRNKIFNNLQKLLVESLKKIIEKYQEIAKHLRKEQATAKDVEEMERYVYDLASEQAVLKQKSSDCFQQIMLMLKQDYDCIEDISALTNEVYSWPERLEKILKDAEEKHYHERVTLENKLREQKNKFDNEIEVYSQELKELEQFTEISKYRNYIEDIDSLEEHINRIEQEMISISDQEKKLFDYVSNYQKFFDMQKYFKPHAQLWKNYGSFAELKKGWMQSSVRRLDPGDIENTVGSNIRITNKLNKQFKEGSLTSKIVKEYKEEVNTMQRYLPHITALSNPGMRERHWGMVKEKMGDNINYEDSTFNQILAQGIQDHLEEIQEISETASKEYKLESMLDKMEKEWENLKFVIIQWKNRDLKILQGQSIEDIQMQLEDHTIKAQTIRQNPDVKFMEARAIRWEKLMLYIQDVLEMWVKVQQMYLYLEPIFSFEDISKTLPNENMKFEEVKRNWHLMMRYVVDDPLVLSLESIPSLLPNLQKSLQLIGEIQKGLEQHLEKKRIEFPRFFFLSNEDLINILSETKDALLIQPHLKKCFEGINELVFNTHNEIIGMKSLQNEQINFIEKVCPKDHKSLVEKWLQMVEIQMRESLGKVMDDSMVDLSNSMNSGPSRAVWLKKWPGQVVLTISQARWTWNVEQVFDSKGTQLMAKVKQEMENNLEEIVSLVRSELTLLERITLGGLIVLEVHAKDVTDLLIKEQVSQRNDFTWIAQLRYYFSQGPLYMKLTSKMITSSIDYGYEYLGNQQRLVLTPLTDRCYRTLMSALQMNLGGAPEGPAGTGKTESTKDLARALGMQCVVFNCSEGLNIHSMAKFFKGLAAAGAWSCFDEFNRIDVEVLSVIAQQILQIQQAKAQMKNKKITKFRFEGVDGLVLKCNCNIFTTMNPGYAGRSELPDNLRALFRPVAMVIADFGLIAEISLYSYGFIDARNLSKKIKSTYKLCSEQLSMQKHYDYGMRAVKAVLVTAQNLKHKFPTEFFILLFNEFFMVRQEDALMFRALCDVNLPKFLANDLKLFEGILADLFPNLKFTPPEYETLNKAIEQAFEALSLQNVPQMKKKVLQLYEMINCRHGLMLVGSAFSGKTTCYQVLQEAFSIINRENASQQSIAHCHIINPKSINIKQLYGYQDLVSKEWNEGIVCEIFRRCSQQQTTELEWMIFDGPVSSDWIENMNTVLDDNKKLCLMNGETIQMTQFMTMMFEVGDLNQASPATISRCGMVYMSEDNIGGWLPLFQSWLDQVKHNFDLTIIEHLSNLFDALVQKCLDFVCGKCAFLEKVPANALMQQLLRVFEALLIDFKVLVNGGIKGVSIESQIIRINILFLNSVIWGIAGGLTEESKRLFSKFLRRLLLDPQKCESKKDVMVKFDKGAMSSEVGGFTVFDYYVGNDFKWKFWKDAINNEDPSMNQQFHEILIETVESKRINFLLNLSIEHEYPFLVIGSSGTGKTRYINTYLKSNCSIEKFLLIFVAFSAQSTSGKTQQSIDGKLERRRKGVYGPPSLGMKCLIFVDDLNMPSYDDSMAQPAIELLRQLNAQEGWYNIEELRFMQIVSTKVIGAMGPPGGGRNYLTGRLLRHFHIVGSEENDEKSLIRIFSMFMNWFDRGNSGVWQKAVECVVEVYLAVKADLKATPSRPHYVWNMRNVSRIIQGIQQIGRKKDIPEEKVCRLVVHELMRVFADPVESQSDLLWLWKTIQSAIRSRMKQDLKMVIKQDYENIKIEDPKEIASKLLFTKIMSDDLGKGRAYDEVNEFVKNEMKGGSMMGAMKERVESFLEDYNSNTKKPLNLVVFEQGIVNLVEVMRVLEMTRSHGLFIGLGGSGRQSLTQLACFINEQMWFEIEMTKSYNQEMWKQDMMKLMGIAGGEAKDVVMVVNESHMRKGFVLEDVNSIMNNGDIPNLFSQEDFLPLIDKLRKIAKKAGKGELLENARTSQYYDYFVENVGLHLHVVLVMSPLGKQLRTRIRNFPSLVNCSQAIWFARWPAEALEAVASTAVHEIVANDGRLTRSLQTELEKNLVQALIYLHQNSIENAAEYQIERGRFVYVTPSIYVELVAEFQRLFYEQTKKLQERKNMYEIGIRKISETSAEIAVMEVDLQRKKPILEETKEEAAKLAAQIQEEVKQMEPLKEVAEEEEKKVNAAFVKAEEIKNECEQDLSKAKPKLKAAQESLGKLEENDVVLLKSMTKPPDNVRFVMEAVCILKGVKPQWITNPNNPKEKTPLYWENGRKVLLSDPKAFLADLINFNPETIPEQIMQIIREKYISRKKDFNPQRVEKASSAARGICEWILALDEYEKVLKFVRPKQLRYNEATAEVTKLKQQLKEKQSELNALQNKIDILQNEYNSTMEQIRQLEQDIVDCANKIKRAEILTSGLVGEQERWKVTAERLGERLKYIYGDMLISSGELSYLGCYDQVYRAKYLKNWLESMAKLFKLEISNNYTFEGSLGEAIEIQKWIRNGLPSDVFSCMNGVIVHNSQRWPLMIDPQIQANKWVKNNEAGNNLKVTKQSDSDFIRKLEDCISFGHPLLIENIGEELDSILDPILGKQTFRNSGVLSMKVGDNIVSYSRGFTLFMTTKLSNPHYFPEVSTKVNLVNFMITSEGLVDQLIEIAVAKERPDLEELNAKLIIQDHECKEQLQQIENNILRVLNREQNILDDEEAVQVLQKSKSLSKEIEEKYAASVDIEQKITETKVSFEPIANHAAVLFEGIVGLQRIEYMYQYSLQWFLELYKNAFDKSERTSFIQQKVENVCNYFTNSIFNNVCRSLFEKDKLLFTLIMLIQIQRNEAKINEQELSFIMNPNIAVQRDSKTPNNSISDLIDEDGWLRVVGLSRLNKYFSGIIKSLEDNKEQWKQVLESDKTFELQFPIPFNECSEIQRVCLMKVLKREHVAFAVKKYINDVLGKGFIRSPTFDINRSYSESSSVNPLVFLLPGTDPMSILQSFADSKNKTMRTISLGQGQGVHAEKAIEEAQKSGTWVFLQNCHLSPSWMGSLERICDAMDTKAGREKTHPSFRLWLSSFPTSVFPISLLQNGIKMTNEAPKGLKSNLSVSYNCDLVQDRAFIEGHSREGEFKALLYGLCFFHAVIQERREFGALGWNCFYDFNQSDLRISIQQLHQFLNETPKAQQVPFNTLHYLVSECNYGGRITDEKDRLTLRALMMDFYSQKVLESEHSLMGLDSYTIPPVAKIEGYLQFIEQLPVNTPPELYGLHANGGIIREINEGRAVCSGLMQSLGTKSKAKNAGQSETGVYSIAEEILEKIPKTFDLNMASVKYPMSYSNSINTVLLQELQRYNQLIGLVQSNLKEILNILKGIVLPSEAMEDVIAALELGKVPNEWMKKSYPSLKPLGSYIADLVARIEYFNGWIFQRQPSCFWISGFFFTQSFMTAILQNFARKNVVAIDKLVMTYQFFGQPSASNNEENSQMFAEEQKDCASYVYGLFLEGAAWDYQNGQLIESQPKVLYQIAPYILFQPEEIDKVENESTYACPVYKTIERKGVLTTTGHSSNYITDVFMPTQIEQQFWIKRGVALICSLSE